MSTSSLPNRAAAAGGGSGAEDLVSLDVTIRIIQGRDLVAMDRNFKGKLSTSDPYVKVVFGGKKRGKTSVAKKTLNPQWEASDATFKMKFGSREANRIARAAEAASQGAEGTTEIKDRSAMVKLLIVDEDKVGQNDPMGTVFVPLIPPFDRTTTNWYAAKRGEYGTKYYCKEAKGALEVKVSTKCIKRAQTAQMQTQTQTAQTKRGTARRKSSLVKSARAVKENNRQSEQKSKPQVSICNEGEEHDYHDYENYTDDGASTLGARNEVGSLGSPRQQQGEERGYWIIDTADSSKNNEEGSKWQKEKQRSDGKSHQVFGGSKETEGNASVREEEGGAAVKKEEENIAKQQQNKRKKEAGEEEGEDEHHPSVRNSAPTFQYQAAAAAAASAEGANLDDKEGSSGEEDSNSTGGDESLWPRRRLSNPVSIRGLSPTGRTRWVKERSEGARKLSASISIASKQTSDDDKSSGKRNANGSRQNDVSVGIGVGTNIINVDQKPKEGISTYQIPTFGKRSPPDGLYATEEQELEQQRSTTTNATGNVFLSLDEANAPTSQRNVAPKPLLKGWDDKRELQESAERRQILFKVCKMTAIVALVIGLAGGVAAWILAGKPPSTDGKSAPKSEGANAGAIAGWIAVESSATNNEQSDPSFREEEQRRRETMWDMREEGIMYQHKGGEEEEEEGEDDEAWLKRGSG